MFVIETYLAVSGADDNIDSNTDKMLDISKEYFEIVVSESKQRNFTHIEEGAIVALASIMDILVPTHATLMAVH
jgi:16S rRNA G527 N7-methylase RsmG